MTVYGIPYFGEQTLEIENKLRETDKTDIQTREYAQLYNLIQENINKKALVIIDNQWFTWLNDIEFNYRDKTASIPYYKYGIKYIENNSHADSKGHIILQEDKSKIGIRYNFILDRQWISKTGRLTIYYIDEDRLEKATWNTWISNSEIEKSIDEILNKLYNLYINQAVKPQDSEHLGGYHFILKHTGFQNIEYQQRQQLGLAVFKSERYKYDEYRDVRQYRQTELAENDKKSIEKLREQQGETWLKHHRDRRLAFESYLYTICRSGRLDNLKFSRGIYKIKHSDQTMILILKQYWLDKYNKKQATYIK